MTRYEGPAIEVTSGGISAKRAIVRSAGKAVHADGTNPDHVDRVEGVSLEAAADGDVALVQVFGPLEDLAWNWTPDQPIYFTAGGVLTQTPPAVGRLRPIGMARSATLVFVNVQPPSDREQTLQLPFAWGDASPATIGVVPADALITQVDIFITAPFNGGSPVLEVGRSGALGELLPAEYCDPMATGTNQANTNRRYVADTPLLLSITPGAGASAGAGLVVVTFQR